MPAGDSRGGAGPADLLAVRRRREAIAAPTIIFLLYGGMSAISASRASNTPSGIWAFTAFSGIRAICYVSNLASLHYSADGGEGEISLA